MKELHTNMEKAQGKVEALCELCTGSKATAFCRQCAEFICDECTKAHHRMKTFAGHKVATLEELKEGGAKVSIKQTPPPTCKVHDEQMKIYCYDCKHLICRDCVIDDHAGHKYEFVKRAAPSIKVKLLECLVPLKEVQVSFHDASEAIKSTKSDVKSQGASAAAKIELSFQVLHKILEQRKQELLEKTSSLVKGKLDELSAQKKGVDMAAGTIQNLVDFVERSIENATEEELVSIHTQVLDRINEETKKHEKSNIDLEPVEEADIVVKVRCVEGLRKLCQDKAVVVSSPADPAGSTVEGDGIKAAKVNKSSKITLRTMSAHGKLQKKPVTIKAKMTSVSSETVIPTKVQEKQKGIYEIEYIPRARGRHQLEITVNGLPVAGSPFPVLVRMPPTQLGKPVKIYPELTGYGVAVNSKGETVFAGTGGNIVFLGRGGEHLHSIKLARDQGGLYGVAVDDDDNIYITNIVSKCVFKFNRYGKEIKSTASINCRGIAVSGDQVIVADYGNHQLLSFTTDLVVRKTINLHDARPGGVACDQDGKIYVSDFHGNCVKVLSAQGELLYSFREKGIHQLKSPHSICVNSNFVYVSEWGNNHSVSVFMKGGRFITSFGAKGNKEGQFVLPSGLAIDNDGFLYVCDFDNDRIQVF